MNLTRVTSTLGAGAVATIAAWSSWSHMVHVALKFGERPEVAYALPVSVDGLLVVASAAMVDDKRAGRAPRMSAKVAFGVGVVASLAANIAAAQPSLGARIVAGWPALALLLTVELLSRSGRRAAAEPASDVAAPVAGSVTPVEPASEPPAAPAKPARPRPTRRPDSAHKVAKVAARMPAATASQIAKAGVSESTVRRYLPATDDTPDDATVTPANGVRPALTVPTVEVPR